jgi:MFS family permease
MGPQAAPNPATGGKLPRNVIALGWVSLFTDAASDMIYPLLPLFLLELKGGAIAIGLIEGVSEAVSAGAKLMAGRLADAGARKKPLVALGYGIAALARPLYALATLPVHAVVVRALDRVGKGLRGPPRDAIVAAAVEPARRGHAFGFHRMMDNFGGVVGPLIAFAMLRFLHWPLRTVFVASVVPGLLSVVLVLAAVREPESGSGSGSGSFPGSGSIASAKSPMHWSRPLRGYFAAMALFALASSGDLFLVRRLADLGLETWLVPFAWLSLQLAKGLLNVTGGKVSDRYGRKPVLVLAWTLYAVSYVMFGLAFDWRFAWATIFVYALHYGLAEGGQRALVAELVPASARGRAFGVQLALEGAMVLPANVGFGAIYDAVGGPTAFFVGAAIAGLAAIALAFVPISREAD